MARESLKRQDLINKLISEKEIATVPQWNSSTITQVETYIDTEIKDLDSAKKIIKEIARMVILLKNGLLEEKEVKKKWQL